MLRFLPFITLIAVSSCHSGSGSKESFSWLGFLADAGLTTAKLSAAGIPILAPLALDAAGAVAGAGLNAYSGLTTSVTLEEPSAAGRHLQGQGGRKPWGRPGSYYYGGYKPYYGGTNNLQRPPLGSGPLAQLISSILAAQQNTGTAGQVPLSPLPVGTITGTTGTGTGTLPIRTEETGNK